MLSGLTVELPKIPMSERASRALAAILQAIGRSVQVRIVYYRFGRLQTIHLEPHRVELSVDCRRLIGRSPQYRQRQRLELEDIVRVDLTDRTFVPPCGFRLGFGRR